MGITARYCLATVVALAWLPWPAVAAPRWVPQVKAAETLAAEPISDWQTRWELARVLTYMKRYDEALREYQLVTAARPDNSEVKLEMARVMVWNGLVEPAAALLGQLSEEQLGEDGLLILVDLQVGQQQWDAALQLLRGYLAKNAGSMKCRFKLAQVLSWQKDYEAALREYETLLQRFPDDVQLRRHYGMVLIWAQHYEQAAAVLRATLPVPEARRVD